MTELSLPNKWLKCWLNKNQTALMNKTKKCECGRTVTLYGYDEECSCGRAYNAFGQRLGPRMLWSDDGDGFYGMNEGEEYQSREEE
jgi:hypothetical protein